MDFQEEVVAGILEVFEGFYYSDYLPDTGMEDSDIAKASFYNMMIEVTKNQDNYPSKELVLKELRARQKKVLDDIQGKFTDPQ